MLSSKSSLFCRAALLAFFLARASLVKNVKKYWAKFDSLFAMQLSMLLEVALRDESLGTTLASEGLFPTVRSLMNN